MARCSPRWLTHAHRVLCCYTVIDRLDAYSAQAARIVREQPETLPEITVDLLTVAGAPHVDQLHDFVRAAPVPRRVVREPSPEGMEVHVRSVQILTSRISHSRGVHDEGRRAQLPLQVTAQSTGHRPAIRLVLDIRIRRGYEVLGILVLRPPGWHALPLVAVQAELLASAGRSCPTVLGDNLRVHIPRTEERVVPIEYVRVVGLHVIRVEFRPGHSHAVECTPQRASVSIRFVNRGQRPVEHFGLEVDLLRGRHARVAPLRQRCCRFGSSIADALFQRVCEGVRQLLLPVHRSVAEQSARRARRATEFAKSYT
eukprot:scaffold62613_cov84-Phaeocystis_antarctica.AAC.1